MEKQKVSEKVLKCKALEFIRSLTTKQVEEVLGENEVMYNDHLDCFFVWRDGRLVMYVNETELERGGRGLGMDKPPEYVEDTDDKIHFCDRCEEIILDTGFIRLDDGREYHYNSRCWPTKVNIKTKE